MDWKRPSTWTAWRRDAIWKRQIPHHHIYYICRFHISAWRSKLCAERNKEKWHRFLQRWLMRFLKIKATFISFRFYCTMFYLSSPSWCLAFGSWKTQDANNTAVKKKKNTMGDRHRTAPSAARNHQKHWKDQFCFVSFRRLIFALFHQTIASVCKEKGFLLFYFYRDFFFFTCCFSGTQLAENRSRR